MSIFLNVLAALVLCLPLLILAIHEHAVRRRAEARRAERAAWIDGRISRERHTGRRTAWRMIRDNDLEKL